MRFGTWNVRSLYRAGSLTAGARELTKCKLDFVSIQEVMWYKGGMGIIIFFYGEGSKNRQLGTGFFVHHRMLSEVKRLDFVSDRMSDTYSSERSLV
jgi:hypothetical protein